MTCDVQEILDEAKCFLAMPPFILEVIQSQLVCDLTSSVTNLGLLNADLSSMKSWVQTSSDEFNNTITADVVWQDGSTGVYTVLEVSPAGFVNSYQITHDSTGQTVTQPPYTRDEVGFVTAKPAQVIT